MNRFWNTRTRSLSPYVPGEQPKVEGLVKLNTNEHPGPPSAAALAVLDTVTGEALRRYPDPEATALRAAIARREQVEPDQVFVGNGSDEVLALAFLALLDDDEVLTVPSVTYSFYPVWAKLCAVPLARIPLTADFALDLDALITAPGPVLIANPNAPTGIAVSRDDVARLAGSDRDRLVVVDEAYFGFGAESAVGLTDQFDNLLITRTLSKSHALAGLRVGYAMGDRGLVEGLVRVKDSFNSYPVDAVAQQVATAAIEDADWFTSANQAVVAAREELVAALADLGFRVLPSSANFVFVEHSQVAGEQLFDGLRERKVLVRRWSKPGIENWLRITIGAARENAALLTALRDVLGH